MQFHQRRTYSGFVIASQTRCGGASNSRVNWISVSDGRVISSLALGFLAMTFLLGLELFEQVIEFFEASLPVLAVALEPVGRFAQRHRLEATGPALGVATPR